MMGFTSLGLKNYEVEVGEVEVGADGTFASTAAYTEVKCKGLSLKRPDAMNIVTRSLMRRFLLSLAHGEKEEVKIPQHRFSILPNAYKIRPQTVQKRYNNASLLQKRLYDLAVSLSQTYPIGATAFY